MNTITPEYLVGAILISVLLAFFASKMAKNEKSHAAEDDENAAAEDVVPSFSNARIMDDFLNKVVPDDSQRYNFVRRAQEAAKKHNDGLPVWKKLAGQDCFCAMDVLQNTAMHEYRSQLEDYFEGVSSISLWRNISKESFEKFLSDVANEYHLEDSSVTKDEVFQHYKEKALRFAQWLEDTKHRAFFMGSLNEIESVICRIRLIAK